MKKIIVYVENAVSVNGILTWIDSFRALMRSDYDIAVMASRLKSRFADRYIQFDEGAEYKCDILIHNYECNKIPDNIQAGETYIILHCDYGAAPERYTFDTGRKYIAVSEVAAQGMRKAFGVDCIAMEGLMETGPERKKVIRLLSATRPTADKGIQRMEKLARIMTEAGYIYQWLIFYDGDIITSHYRSEHPGMIPAASVPNEILLQYMADADYVVQLSDSEGFCRAVHESLLMGTPVIVTDIPVFSMIKDGYNGYRLPLDMEGIDVKRIMTEIPEGFTYKSNTTALREKWYKILGGA